jgi:hypothetical protein
MPTPSAIGTEPKINTKTKATGPSWKSAAPHKIRVNARASTTRIAPAAETARPSKVVTGRMLGGRRARVHLLDSGVPLTLKALVPMAHVRSVPRSIDFYRKLGFVEGNTHTPEGGREPVWAWLTSGGAQFMLALASEPVDPEKQAVL